MPDEFDRVLADVPCSGERHLFENQSELSLWTEKRTKNLAVRQYSLLSSAWLACKPGGRIVYSTCSISPMENDEVVQKLIKKRKPEILTWSAADNLDFVEKTEHGYQILPDRSGFGPMYFAVIRKV
jgi:16S rRNA C967 or C1407 C5-methylase (RsmB/RsmF family)